MSPVGEVQRTGPLRAHVSQALVALQAELVASLRALALTGSEPVADLCAALHRATCCHTAGLDGHLRSLPTGTILFYTHQPLLRSYSDLAGSYSTPLAEL